MSYAVQVAQSTEQQIGAWGLAADLLDEVHRRLTIHLAQQGTAALRRVRAPIDVWLYSFVLIDGAVPRCQHFFQFQVVVSQDEQTLVIVGAGHTSQVTGASPFGPEELN